MSTVLELREKLETKIDVTGLSLIEKRVSTSVRLSPKLTKSVTEIMTMIDTIDQDIETLNDMKKELLNKIETALK